MTIPSLFRTRFAIITALSCVAILIFGLLATPKKVPVTLTVVALGDARETVIATGRVVSESTMRLSFALPGQMRALTVREGDTVEAGAVLALLADVDRKAQAIKAETDLDIAKAERERLSTTDRTGAEQRLAQAQSRFAVMDQTFKRLQNLVDKGGATPSDIESAERDRDIAQSDVEQARNDLARIQSTDLRLAHARTRRADATLAEATYILAGTRLIAPARSIVTAVALRAGEFASAGSPVLTLLPLDTATHVAFDADETSAGKILPGQRAVIRSPALPDSVFEASVERVSPTIDKESGTFSTLLSTGRPLAALPVGLSVQVQVVTREFANVITIPSAALVGADSARAVFIDVKGKAIRRPISGRGIGGGLFLVETGLSGGERVIYGTKLKEGSRIIAEGKSDQ